MINPAGKECSFFHGDYHRGREHEECRLLQSADLDWQPYLCEKCFVPEIIMANGCEHMKFSPSLARPLFFMKEQVQIKTTCTKCECTVDKPQIGCGQCHPDLNFIVADIE